MENKQRYSRVLVFIFVLICSVSLTCGGQTSKRDSAPFKMTFISSGCETVPEAGAERWTPSIQLALHADSVILAQRCHMFSMNIADSLYPGCPIIAKNWKKYSRQFIGCYNKKGHKILEVQYIWEADTIRFPDWRTERVHYIGGCTYFWSVKYDLKRKKPFDYIIF